MHSIFSLHNSEEAYCSINTVYGSHEQTYRDLTVIKSLSKTRLPLYRVQSNTSKSHYFLKLFFHDKTRAQLIYHNGRRFLGLQHHNLLRGLYFEDEVTVVRSNIRAKASYIITEHAPNGNFVEFIKYHGKYIDDKLARTYFRQLISGLEYLHENGVSHMNLKLGSLWLDQDFNLKIADLEMAHFKEDAIVLSEGTTLFKAPEVAAGRCKDPNSADIYSAGIILFVLKTKGIIPQFEDESVGGVNFADLLRNDVEKFWACHERETGLEFDGNFRELFIAMTKFECKERASIEVIKASNWYNGPIYNDEELESKMDKIFRN